MNTIGTVLNGIADAFSGFGRGRAGGEPEQIRDRRTETVKERGQLFMARLSGWSLGKRVHFYEALSKFVSKGEPPKRYLAVWQERMAKRKDPMQHLVARWRAGIGDGDTFSEVIAPWVPNAERTLIAAGENSGSLDEGLRQAAFVARASRQMRSTVIANSAYPIVLVLVGIAGLGIVAYRIVPIIEKASKIPREALPLVSRILFGLGDAVNAYWPFALGLMVAGTIAFATTLGSWQGPVRRWLDRFGVLWPVYRRYQGAMLIIALAGMIQTGTKLADALRTTAAMASPWIRWHINRMLDRVSHGDPVADALDTGLLDHHTLDMIDAYSRSSSVDTAIVTIGRESIDEAVLSVKRAMGWVFVILLLVVGSIALLALTGVLYAVMEMATRAQGQGIVP